LEEIRHRGIEELQKVENAGEHRQHAVEELKEVLDAKMENVHANQEAHKKALLERLREEVGIPPNFRKSLFGIFVFFLEVLLNGRVF
jgi:hypothetical protein